MKTALIAGATGLVGSHLTDQLLDNEQYSRVKILVRKPIEKNHHRLEQIIYDYDQPDLAAVRADEVYCCLGTTIKKAGSREAFRKVDLEYPLQIARAAKQNGTKHFAIVTAIGSSTKSAFFYNRVKGEIEELLKEAGFERLLIFRPSMLLGPRSEFRFGEEAGKVIFKAAGFLFPKNMKGIHAAKVAAAMIWHMQKEKEKGIRYIESGQMQQFPVNSSPK